ncbi:UDP-N-acetylmuramate dehydrogenase [Kineococcus gynurae]|uniref:UDP-N-acetylenolpyruvoylglucosamine reductase n=1 Tax=Kineococcus gynurae TaxID=452979 RepID=A0ABV5LTL5_9ACTN
MTSLAELTTLRVGGPARTHVVARTERELVEAVSAADAAGEPLLLVGGGSNLLVADEGFPGTVVQIATTGVSSGTQDFCSGSFLTVAAGEDWDAFVARTVELGLSGMEALSGIPGSVGATPVQNVGAYGQDVSQTVSAVRTWDRQTGRVRTLAAGDLAFGYRDSLLKRSRIAPPAGPADAHPESRYVVLDVSFQLTVGLGRSQPVVYPELARALGIEVGERAPLADVRAAVLALRAGKGMVLDRSGPEDHDTWSAGSFFTNPILTVEQAATLPADAPRFPAGEGRVKTSAAWLIDRAGFGKGFGLVPAATLSTRHTLALTNRGGATAADLLDLARTVAAGVESRFGVRISNEPVLVGCSL